MWGAVPMIVERMYPSARPIGRAIRYPHPKSKRTENSFDRPITITPSINLAAPAKMLLSIILAYVLSQSLPHFAGINIRHGQPLRDQIIINRNESLSISQASGNL
jgi:hypothetical protein